MQKRKITNVDLVKMINAKKGIKMYMPKRNTNVESGHENHQCQKGIKKCRLWS